MLWLCCVMDCCIYLLLYHLNNGYTYFLILKSYNLNFIFKILIRGEARKFLEGGSKSSKMLVAMFGRRRFLDAERLKWYVLDLFQWDFTYSSLTLLAAGQFYIPWILIEAWAGQYGVSNTGLELLFFQN